MSIVHRSPRRLALAAAFLLTACVAALLLSGGSSRAQTATVNANNYDCQGHLEAGKALPGDDDTPVKYVFACNGPITGYQVQPSLAATNFDTDAIVLDKAGSAVLSDSFTCNGDFPNYGINCVGTYSGNYANVSANFAIGSKLCDEPRVDALLSVVYATADSTGKVTQYISGPYDLGRPHGCPKPKKGSVKPRIPND